MNVKSESEVAQSYPAPSDPMDYSPPGSSIHGICQARVLEWVATAPWEALANSAVKKLARRKVNHNSAGKQSFMTP